MLDEGEKIYAALSVAQIFGILTMMVCAACFPLARKRIPAYYRALYTIIC